MDTTQSQNRTLAALLVTVGMIVVIGSALAFEHIGGYIPCHLCLIERKPYYIGIPLGVLAVVSHMLKLPVWITRTLLGLIALLMIADAGISAYHAGVEYKWWDGPSSCTFDATSGGGGGGDILSQLNDVHGPSCSDAAIRILGLSLAGWNVIAGLVLSAIAAFGAKQKAA
ncbi:disulfide bond formation protein B [Rhizobium halophytocola]|uniref:Disulfide bond formation protein DsbB n=1 Tax=Rhizobium halophytocola TaxID=735519 RepID=A0ABS4E2I5_9HYPH|nr:disulfide bond formation protein B [Rhizobium halophytocola]MBP1852155.1 disulfide bond formation protein DsbB [Rhizobium halophytocola]